MNGSLETELGAVAAFLGSDLPIHSYTASGAWLDRFLATSEAVAAEYDFYTEYLLPAFLSFAEDRGFAILDWNRKEAKEPFQQLLGRLLHDFNHHISPTVYRGIVYFVRCYAEEVRGMPRTREARESFLEDKALFSYKAYKATERIFFGMLFDNVNLNHACARLRRAKVQWESVAALAMMVALVLLSVLLG